MLFYNLIFVSTYYLHGIYRYRVVLATFRGDSRVTTVKASDFYEFFLH